MPDRRIVVSSGPYPSRGIGRVIATHLATLGASVAIHGTTPTSARAFGEGDSLEALARTMAAETDFPDKGAARAFFQTLTQVTKDWNRAPMESAEFGAVEARLESMVAEVARDA